MSISLPLTESATYFPKTNPIGLTTHDGQACHASLLDFDNLLPGIGAWPKTGANRYKYWMGLTPSSENMNCVNIRASNDPMPVPNLVSQTWVEPPITPTQHSSLNASSGPENDDELVYDPDLDCIYVYWSAENVDIGAINGPYFRFRINNQLVVDEELPYSYSAGPPDGMTLDHTTPIFSLTCGAAVSVTRESATRWHAWGVHPGCLDYYGAPAKGDFGYQFSPNGIDWYPDSSCNPAQLGQYTICSPTWNMAAFGCFDVVHSEFRLNPYLPGVVDCIFSALDQDYAHGAEWHSRQLYCRTTLSNPTVISYPISSPILTAGSGDWNPMGFYRSSFTVKPNTSNEMGFYIYVDGYVSGVTDLFGFASGPLYTFTLPATPAITTFTVPAASHNLTIPVAIIAVGAAGVTGYIVSESGTAPLPGDSRWSATPPASYTFAGYGSYTLHAWVKDASGNVSAGTSANVAVTAPPPERHRTCTVKIGG